MTKTCSIGLVLSALLLVPTQALLPQERDKSVNEYHFKELPNFARVNERLYRGGQPRKNSMERLVALGVKTIINLRDDDEKARTEADAAKTAGIHYFNVPLKRFGRPNNLEVARILSLIGDKENGIVFVHCHKGEDRTGLIIALFRISHDGWSAHDAIQEAKRFGMAFWQVQMRDYISDYSRDRSNRAHSRAR